jgi:hypothetical protein
VAKILHLSAYRAEVRLDGTTLVWRDLYHYIELGRVRAFCEALERTNRHRVLSHGAGFSFIAAGKNILISGWDMGPMVLPAGDQAARFGIRLMAAARVKAGAEGPVMA